MKDVLLTTLRNQKTNRHEFRHATEQLSLLLAGEAGSFLKSSPELIETPIEETEGKKIAGEVIIIPILRAGLAMLPSFLKFYPNASVGFFGMRRDEITKKPHLYYENIPQLLPHHQVMLIDPMIATGGSGVLALEKLKACGIQEGNVIYVGIVAAPEGIDALKKAAPKLHLVLAAIDARLNQDAFIVPGLGDFGDRYFGTETVL